MSRRCHNLLAMVCLALSAPLAGAAEMEKYTPAERRHWAFQKRGNPSPPSVAGGNPIDAFIVARLQKEGLRPAPAAPKPTLIRRLYFDLTGLPPTPEEVDAFVRDTSANAYEKLVDRLLASPRYGERWAQHWLDVVRFAETDGFEYDTHRPDAWRFRDYVIRSLNADKPYDQFVREQLAGDEMASPNEEYKIASGFNRLGPLRKNAGNQEVASSRNEVLTEMTNVVGAALLGVTLGCARCHDHKFDPIRHTDYYRMQSFFSATFENDVPLASQQEQADWKARTDAVQEEMKAVKKAMKDLQGPDLMRMEQKLKEVEAKLPPPLPALYAVTEHPEKRTPIHVLARGDYQNKGQAVGMRPLGVLLEDGAAEWTAAGPTPRLELAKWITQPDHPLTARVMVNRVWQYHFGRGIVATPNDFGRMGNRPTHPELLDFLANRFVEGGWRLKPLHKLIVMSNTYRQASRGVAALEAKAKETDPENKLLWKYTRRRLTAEEIRDAMLATAGVLNTKAGGPSIMLRVDQELIDLLYKPSQWQVAEDPAEHNRRSVYLLAKRNLRLPMMEVFDQPDTQISCARRESSTHPPQALELLNGDLSNRMATALAARLEREAPGDAGRQVDLAWRLATGKAPAPAQKMAALNYLQAGQPLKEFALAVLNLNSFLYVE